MYHCSPLLLIVVVPASRATAVASKRNAASFIESSKQSWSGFFTFGSLPCLAFLAFPKIIFPCGTRRFWLYYAGSLFGGYKASSQTACGGWKRPRWSGNFFRMFDLFNRTARRRLAALPSGSVAKLWISRPIKSFGPGAVVLKLKRAGLIAHDRANRAKRRDQIWGDLNLNWRWRRRLAS